jgi:ATP-dependent helicase YprA (DUF1998 family)
MKQKIDLADSNLKLAVEGQVATLVFRRHRDGHELSLSSVGKSLVEFAPDGSQVVDHASFHSTESFVSILLEFLDAEVLA